MHILSSNNLTDSSLSFKHTETTQDMQDFVRIISVNFSCQYVTLVLAIISLEFIANYATPDELAGVSLANAWVTTFYFGICNSINDGLQVVASQLYGANKHDQLIKDI